MDPIPNVTEAIIRQQASADSHLRGREYYEQGAVLRVVRRGQQVQAEVEGSQYEPYRVQITYDAGGIAQAICSCPYDWGGWCKHIMATLLACVHDPAHIDERPSLQTLLAGLDGAQLQALLLRVVELQPELVDVIEAQVQRWQIQPVGDAPALRQRRTSIDPDVLRRQVRSTLRSLGRMRRSEAYWHVSAVVDEVRQVLEQTKGFVAAGDGRNALAILEAVTEAYITDWVELDDSDGEANAFFADLGSVWTEAILAADLTIQERRSWAKKLAQWQHKVEDYGVDEAFEAAVSEVVRMMVQLMEPQESMSIYDPTAGSGGMLIQSKQYVEEAGGNAGNLDLSGQDSNGDTWVICKMKMILHGITSADIRQGDTLREP